MAEHSTLWDLMGFRSATPIAWETSESLASCAAGTGS